MRESNFNYVSQNKACVCITSALYDRRAIDAPAPSLPLVNSLTHLSYLTATSPRVREILSLDGGLERLVRILKRCAAGPSEEGIEETLLQLKGKGKWLARGARKSPFRPFAEWDTLEPCPPLSIPLPSPTAGLGKQLMYTYTLAFQCIVNIGVRGSELIRTRVVEAGALDVVVHVLERYLEKVAARRIEAEKEWRKREVRKSSARIVEIVVDSAAQPPLDDELPSFEVSQSEREANTPNSISEVEAANAKRALAANPLTSSSAKTGAEDPGRERDDDGDVVMEAQDASATQTATGSHSEPPNSIDAGLPYRDEDVLLSLQLLAYLSKYPHVRSVFHSPAPPPSPPSTSESGSSSFCSSTLTTENKPTDVSNVFSLVEQFTHRPPTTDRFTPRYSLEVQYWAGVIMRNACRKDESQGGIRQCANMSCGVWEKSAREFAKCRRCRKAKYCSKVCQSRAWQFGHRYWCAKATPRDAVDDDGHSHHAHGGRHHHHRSHHPIGDLHVQGEGDVDSINSSQEDVSMGEHMASNGARPSGLSSRSRARGGELNGSQYRGRHDGIPRPGSAVESNDDDDDVDVEDHLPPPAGSLRGAPLHANTAPHVVGVGGIDVAVGGLEGTLVGLNEDEVAQEMMGGGVFGERVRTGRVDTV